MNRNGKIYFENWLDIVRNSSLIITWKLERSGTDGCLLNVGSVLSHLTKGAFVSLFPVFYLSFLCFFFAFFVCFCTFFLHFWHVCIISFKFLNWKTLYFKVQLTKRPPAPFSRSNSEVDFCPFVSCLERRIQYWSLETKYSVQYWGSPMPIMPKNGWISWNLDVHCSAAK